MLDEIEDLVKNLSTDAQAANMHWLDIDSAVNQLDNAAIRAKLDADLEAQRLREEKEHELAQQRKEDLMKEANDRDREIFEKTKQ